LPVLTKRSMPAPFRKLARCWPRGIDRRRLLFAILLFLAVLAVFSVCLPNNFVSIDDHDYVTSNPVVRSGLGWFGLTWAFGNHMANWHPLTWLSHMLDCQVYGLRPWGHHLTSILLHGANTILLFLLLDRMTGALWRSLFIAALFAFHPLHVESVAWVAERKDVLSTFFWMLTLLAYSAWARRPVSAGRLRMYLLSLLCFVFGLMSKPMLVTTPFLLLLLDCWPLKRFSTTGRWKTAISLVVEKIPFFVFAAVSSVITFIAQKQGGAVGSFINFSFDARMENAFVSYCRYLGKLFVPRDLAVFYPNPGAWSMGQANSAIVLIVTISILALLIHRRYPPFFVGWFWFVGTLIPVIGIIQVGSQAMADRYTYFPAIGIFILTTWSIADLFAQLRFPRPILAAGGSGAVVLLSLLTIRQLTYWRNSTTLFQHAVDAGQECDVVEQYLGMASADLGRNEEAVAYLRKAEQLNPRNGYVRLILGTVLDKEGHTQAAFQEVRQAALLGASLSKTYFYEGLLLEKVGRRAEALSAYEKAAAVNDDLPFVHYNLAVLLQQLGRTQEAIVQYRAELKRNPRLPEAYNNLGKALLATNQTNEAIRAFRAAIQFRPNFAEAHNNLGGALYLQGQKEEALAEFRKALQLRPDYSDAKKNLAIAIGKSP
jgi:protein O-mannosyl-transferase